MKLCEFSVEKGTFVVFGEYEIEKSTDMYNRSYEYPEFSNLTAKKKESDVLVDYEPDGTSWSGRHYDVEDMITECISNSMLGNSLFNVTYLDDGLRNLIQEYMQETSVVVDGKGVSKRILHGSMLNVYTLELVTNEYIYYLNGDEFLMVGTESREVISDNYFASIGYSDSIESVRDGNEVLLYGELPEEEEE